ncbi:hypothetical protein Poli38472_014727 [Pythium oligandrum]|uniref:Uncharacterized protein n=1 Tax=Pythium oligandrum TaxID=41045 RepID=A0A8K1C1Y5_PYTOL|nr:hypothetical protein Poli38472_014727 [Pythium oligandrum]|eukprot:TMW54956.1 hypothetical protein Poli38472_014727 [Pythium oligandrum]
MLKRVLLIAAVVCATVSASPFKQDPYTRSDGTVIDNSNPDAVKEPASTGERSIYTPLSNSGPMAGVGRPPQQGRALKGIRSRKEPTM